MTFRVGGHYNFLCSRRIRVTTHEYHSPLLYGKDNKPLENDRPWAGGVAHCLGALDTFAEDPGLGSSNHMKSHNQL